jgi:hypothetical protein
MSVGERVESRMGVVGNGQNKSPDNKSEIFAEVNGRSCVCLYGWTRSSSKATLSVALFIGAILYTSLQFTSSHTCT